MTTLVVVKEAVYGQPIYKFYRDWKADASGTVPKPGETGRLYKKLMEKVDEAMAGKPAPDPVTFVWMQGEADAKADGDVYEQSLKGLIAQVRGDLKRNDVTVVIGRLSDYAKADDPRHYRGKIREIQVTVATADPLAAWVDTDDLNGTYNGLHYNKDGYRILGERFAAQAIALIQKQAAAKANGGTSTKL